MIERKQLRKGKLFWWAANGEIDRWSCPCVVTYVGKKFFRLMSLDDFKETVNFEYGLNRPLKELRNCSLDEVETYLRDEICALQGVVDKDNKELAESKEALRVFQEKAKGILKKHSDSNSRS